MGTTETAAPVRAVPRAGHVDAGHVAAEYEERLQRELQRQQELVPWRSLRGEGAGPFTERWEGGTRWNCLMRQKGHGVSRVLGCFGSFWMVVGCFSRRLLRKRSCWRCLGQGRTGRCLQIGRWDGKHAQALGLPKSSISEDPFSLMQGAVSNVSTADLYVLVLLLIRNAMTQLLLAY